jgi:hypothetical protein
MKQAQVPNTDSTYFVKPKAHIQKLYMYVFLSKTKNIVFAFHLATLFEGMDYHRSPANHSRKGRPGGRHWAGDSMKVFGNYYNKFKLHMEALDGDSQM